MKDFGEMISLKIGLDIVRPDQFSRFSQFFEDQRVFQNLSEEDFIHYLRKNPSQLQKFIEALSVGETYFFRHAKQWEALRDYIVKNWREKESFSFLSIGCATGEEAYSLAILMEELGLWTRLVSITGIDINQDFLDRAKRGVYSSNSFREETPDHISRYFIPKENSREILPKFREKVFFQKANLLEPFSPPGPVDLILFRNVMIYFHEKAREKALLKIASFLSPEGILTLAPCEYYPVKSLKKFQWKGSFFYGKSGEPAGSNQLFSPENISERLPPPKRHSPSKKQKKPTHPNPPDFSSNQDTKSFSLEEIRALANRGRYMEALEKMESKDLESCYLSGICLENLGLMEEALDAYKEGVAFDDSSPVIYLRMGDVFLSLQKIQKARESYSQAEKLFLQARDPIPFSDGIPAKVLLELTRENLKDLKDKEESIR